MFQKTSTGISFLLFQVILTSSISLIFKAWNILYKLRIFNLTLKLKNRVPSKKTEIRITMVAPLA